VGGKLPEQGLEKEDWLGSIGGGKGKVVPMLPLPKHHAMKAYGGVEVQLHPFFDLGTRRS
jgi:hypothetical protein